MVHHLGSLDTACLNIIRGRGRGEEALHFENAVTRCSPGQPQVVHHFANVPLKPIGFRGILVFGDSHVDGMPPTVNG